MAEQPLYRYRSGAEADIPKQLTVTGRERGKRHRADIALGELPVIFKKSVAKSGCERDDGRAGIRHHLNRDGVERRDVSEVEVHGRRAAHPLARPTERFENSQPRSAHPPRRQQLRDPPRRRLVPG